MAGGKRKEGAEMGRREREGGAEMGDEKRGRREHK